MSEKSAPIWRSALDIVVETTSAEQFREELARLREKYGDDPENIGAIHTGVLIDLFAGSAGLFAALQLPPDEVPAALAEIRETLSHLDLKTGRRRLKRDERRYYDHFARIAAPILAELGAGMEALFNCYVAGDYDPEANPNDLIAEALQIAEKDLDRARPLITQAGAIALHGRPLWWRWYEEAYGPAAPWLTTTFNLVADYTSDGQNPLGPLEKARAEAESTIREVDEEFEEMEKTEEEEKPEPLAEAPSPVDDLIEELLEQGEEPFTPEQLKLCRAHREEAIPALIDLASDEYLQIEDSPGDGYAPIRAVQLLGAIKATEAIPDLIDIVAYSDPIAIICSAAIHALENIGPPALEPLLDFLRYSWDVETKTALADAIVEAGRDDERTYKALVELWDETTWEEGKCLLAHCLAQTGGERAIPLIETALENPDLDWMDYNEVAATLEEMGVKVPPAPADISPFDVAALVRSTLSDISEPEHLVTFADATPEEWRSHPDGLAHTYADIEQAKLNSLITIQAIGLPLELSAPLVADLLKAAETLAFDASTRGYPRWLRKAYTHLAECAGPDLQLHLIGVLLSLHHYLSGDYDIADDPDQLLAAARELSPNDEEQQQLFGRAGALMLHGRSFWPRWPDETDLPLSGWLEGLVEFRHPLERVGQIPLQPSLEIELDELSDILMEALMKEEPPPAVAKLLELLVAQGQDSLSPAQRRRFARQRATIIPHLIHLVEDKQYWLTDGPGEGWAAILAVQLLGELKATQAANTLVSAAAYSGPADTIHDAALFSLIAIGRPALPAVQTYFRYGRDVEAKTSLAEVLGCLGRRSPDTFELLRQVWETAGWAQNRRTVALALGDLRDRRAIPLLQAALEDRSADALDQDYVRWALQRLGTPAPEPPMKKPSRLKTPAPFHPRLIYDEFDTPQRLKYTPWNEMLCPDCGQPLVQDESGVWVHPPESVPSHSAAARKGKSKRKKKRH